MRLEDFRGIWCADFEFRQLPGELPDPICFVAIELRTGCLLRFFKGEISEMAPYSLGNDSLFVAFAASADLLCHIALGWKLPCHVIDLFAEFRNCTNFVDKSDQRANLLSALAHFGIPHTTSVQKEGMRKLAERGGPWSEQEKNSLLKYCESDVVPLPALFRRLTANLDLDQALERGRYTKAVAVMESIGVPIDVDILSDLRRKWVSIHLELISRVDSQYRVFDGIHFRFDRFEKWLADRGIEWPSTPTGRPCTDAETFRDMALAHPEVGPLHQLRATLGSMKLESLSVGPDGRNRVSLKPFASLASRNQPSTSKFIFGPATWLRYLIKPALGYAVAYIDFNQQEFAVAAVLSGDSAMQHGYLTADPYLEFAKQAGAAPRDATKKTHGAVRDLFKTCCLAVMYGMSAKGLALRIDKSEIEAQRLLKHHQTVYPKFWEWSERVVDHMQLIGRYATGSGWSVRRNYRALSEHNKRSVRNFPVQATGADILRLSCCLGIERGIQICAPIHDAVLIEAPLSEIDDAVSTMRHAMAEASRAVLGGFEIRTEAKIFTDRFLEERGAFTWRLVRGLLRECQPEQEQCSLWGT
jgi:DNA polymerase I